ncbi:hypothetical protein K435DRAFT_675914, partial [Dendrothele bispora CBS 962.96]
MAQALPQGTTTFRTHAGRYTRPDNTFISATAMNMVIECDTRPEIQAVGADHIPIIITLDLQAETVEKKDKYNFRTANWKEKVRPLLQVLLTQYIGAPKTIASKHELDETTELLTKAIQETTQRAIPKIGDFPKAKRWWNNDLTKMKKDINRLNKEADFLRAVPNDPIHQKLK